MATANEVKDTKVRVAPQLVRACDVVGLVGPSTLQQSLLDDSIKIVVGSHNL